MSQRSLQQKIDVAEKLSTEWISNRKEVRRKFIALAEKLNEHQKNVNIAKVTGSSAAIVGTGLVIGGFVASFFTFGISLMVSAVGAGIGGAGGITACGADIANQILSNDICKEAQKSIDKDQVLTDKIQSQIKAIKLEISSIERSGLEKFELKFSDKVRILFNVCMYSLRFGKKVVYDTIKTAKVVKTPARLAFTAADLASDAGTNVFRALSTTGRVLHVAGFVASVVLLPLDISTLIKSSISLNKGNVTEAEKKIREIAETMVCPEVDEIPNMLREYIEEELLKE